MPKGKSSDEKRGKALRAMEKKQRRDKNNKAKSSKRKRDWSDSDDGSDIEGLTPAERLQMESGRGSLSSNHKKKKRLEKKAKEKALREDHIGGSSIAPNSIPAPDFSHAPPFTKKFWKGPMGQDPPSSELKEARKRIGVNVRGLVDQCPPPISTISDTTLPESFGVCWPAILNGANILGLSPTGSGKTLAYGVPMIPHIRRALDTKKAAPLALVLVPTRELALQQLEDLRAEGGVHIAVSTPGRLLDLVATKHISLRDVTYLVIDEADRMLQMGFYEQLQAISKQVRPSRQALMFSATFPGRLREACTDWIGEAVHIRCSTFSLNHEEAVAWRDHEAGLGSLSVSASVVQEVHVCATHKKPRLLIKFIERRRAEEKEAKVRQPGNMLVFCTKIKTLKFGVVVIHGQMPQGMRERSLADFKAGKSSILLATDVAARGLHIKKLRHVVNYDFPGNLEQYCHRVGRTGRQGEVGHAYSLITRNLAPMVADLVELLRKCSQQIEPNLLALEAEFAAGGFNAESSDEELEEEGGRDEGEQA
eukprot:GSChrysophyteH1.ASY1.ANO1.519.1 assembled CDS